MVGEWQSVPLERLVQPGRSISYGIVQPGSHVHDGVPIIRVSDIRNGQVSIIDPLRVSPAVEALHSRTRLQGGELLLTLVGTVGEAAVVPKSLAGWNTARAVAVIPVQDDVGAYWVKIALHSPVVRELIYGRLNTTVQATLNLRDVAELPIVIPPLRDRGLIINTLSALDDQVELNCRKAETLEAMARALFRCWFVDFEPVRAKTDGRPSELPDDLAVLFPNVIDDGGIPAGWNRVRLDRLVELAYGKALIAQNRRTGSIPVFGSNGQVGVHDEALVRGPGIVVGRKGNPGTVTYIPVDFFCIDTTYYVVRRSQDLPISFLWLLLEQLPLPDLSADSAVPGLNRDAAYSLRVVRPPASVLEAFAEFAEPLLEGAQAARNENETLVALRDTLLPKLISAELRIADAEKKTAAA